MGPLLIFTVLRRNTHSTSAERLFDLLVVGEGWGGVGVVGHRCVASACRISSLITSINANPTPERDRVWMWHRKTLRPSTFRLTG